MKKYFAKYLPVEGEIKEGDTVIHKVTNDIGTVTKVSDEGKYQDEEVIKVKLFLCSKDIQVDDVVKSKHGFTEIIEQVMNGEYVETNLSKKEHINNVYKIIGEISPDAIWVTEGMEFDEGELSKVLYYTDREPENHVPIDVCPIEGYTLSKTVFRIKCPTCKTYH